MPRLFVAVVPAESVVDQLAALPRTHARIRWVRPEQWHVTLRFLADADPSQIAHLLDRHDFPSATAVFGPETTTLGSAVVVPVSGLDALAEAVAEATAAVPGVDPRPFHGHLTIGRYRGRSVPKAVLGRPIAARQEVRQLVLFESQRDRNGHTHVVRSTRSVGAGGV